MLLALLLAWLHLHFRLSDNPMILYFSSCQSLRLARGKGCRLRGGDNWHSSREGAESLDVPSSHCTTSYLSTSVDYTLPYLYTIIRYPHK